MSQHAQPRRCRRERLPPAPINFRRATRGRHSGYRGAATRSLRAQPASARRRTIAAQGQLPSIARHDGSLVGGGAQRVEGRAHLRQHARRSADLVGCGRRPRAGTRAGSDHAGRRRSAREPGRPATIRLYTGAVLETLIGWYARHGYEIERVEQLDDRKITHMKKIVRVVPARV